MKAMSEVRVRRNLNSLERHRRTEYWPYNTAYAVVGIPTPDPPAPPGVGTLYEPFSVAVNLRGVIKLDKLYSSPSSTWAYLLIDGSTVVAYHTHVRPDVNFFEVPAWAGRQHSIKVSSTTITAQAYDRVPGSSPPTFAWYFRHFDLVGPQEQTATPNYSGITTLTFNYNCRDCTP